MRSILFLAAAIFLAASASASEIVVYKGSGRYTASLGPVPLPATTRMYIVADFETGEVGSIAYFVKAGKHAASVLHSWSVTRANGKNVKPVTVLAHGTVSKTDADTFNFNSISFRGYDTSLKIATSPTPRLIARPRIMTGVVLNNGSDDSGGNFSDLRLTLSFNAALTIAANNASKTVPQIIADLRTGLEAQGYVFE